MTASQRLFEIANALAGENVSKNYEPTFTGAFDALTDTLAGYDVERGKTISEAIKAAAPYISGGSGEGGGGGSEEMVDFGVVLYVNSGNGWQYGEFDDPVAHPILVDMATNEPIDFSWEETLEEGNLILYEASAPAGHMATFSNSVVDGMSNSVIPHIVLGMYSSKEEFYAEASTSTEMPTSIVETVYVSHALIGGHAVHVVVPSPTIYTSESVSTYPVFLVFATQQTSPVS